MPLFSYKAVDRSGAMDIGSISASDERGAQRQLREKGLTPVSLLAATGGMPQMSSNTAANSRSAAKNGLQKPLFQRTSGEVGRKEVLRFTSELSVLLKAGLPLDRAIKVQIDSAPEGAMRTLLTALLESLKGGKALSVGLETHQEVFDGFYINMVRSGEASGRLDAVLAELAVYLERSRAIRSSVVSALIYPAILAAVAVISVVIMLGFVVPEFEALFEDMGDALPLLTEIVIAMGDVIAAWGWLLLLLGVGGWLWSRRWLATDAGQRWADERSLSLPLMGGIVVRYEVAQFSRTMGTLLTHGVPMLTAANIAVATVRNSVIKEALTDVAPVIKRGGRLSETMDESVFSPVAVQMVRVGEESGSLDAMLMQLAQVYEGEVEAEIKRALTLLEPVLILVMGGMIAVIIVAILMGILSVNQLAV